MSRYGGAGEPSRMINIHGAVTASVLKIGPGMLSKIILNTMVNGSTVSIYDGVTAVNPIAIIVPTIAGTGYVILPTTVDYHCDFQNGLCITTVNASTDVTVVYE